jgi:hypothetical protein
MSNKKGTSSDPRGAKAENCHSKFGCDLNLAMFQKTLTVSFEQMKNRNGCRTKIVSSIIMNDYKNFGLLFCAIILALSLSLSRSLSFSILLSQLLSPHHRVSLKQHPKSLV